MAIDDLTKEQAQKLGLFMDSYPEKSEISYLQLWRRRESNLTGFCEISNLEIPVTH
jgi:hypothetical protein